jgi:hypothetical protein
MVGHPQTAPDEENAPNLPTVADLDAAVAEEERIREATMVSAPLRYTGNSRGAAGDDEKSVL